MHTLYTEWFANKHWWFDAKPKDDEYIKASFESLLDVNTDLCMCHKCKIGQIILYDQVPRHVFRNTSSAHIIEYFLKRALVLSECTLMSIDKKQLTNSELCFVLLPLRHTKKATNIFRAIQAAWQRLKSLETPDLNILRFLKASYSRTPTFNQSGLVSSTCSSNTVNGHIDVLKLMDVYKDILVPQCHHDQCPQSDNNTSFCFDAIENMCKCLKNDTSHIILSISGGVDSMVCSYIFNKVCQTHGITMDCVHINYCNKQTSMQDELFVTDWCTYIGVPIHVRRISEINRADCMKFELRDVYESYTRNVRYNTYKYVSGLRALQSTFVVLGHNKDDCFENIVNNLTQEQKYDNLVGMMPISMVDGINFVRPLLDVSKVIIRAFASMYDIPHLYDSTPVWSQRGRIRATIVPVLETWDTRSIQGLHVMAKHMKDLHEILVLCIDSWVSRRHSDGSLILDFNELSKNSLVWKEYIKRITKVCPSHKAITNFVKKLTQWTVAFNTISNGTELFIVLKKGINIRLSKQMSNKVHINIHVQNSDEAGGYQK
jgi:tRNA(Ile)-lysidine synthetase-like protein